MKTRNGFVSNSSSSSFVIGIPKNLSNDEAFLLEKMGVKDKTFFYPVAKQIAKCILANEKKDEEIFESFGFKTKEECLKSTEECDSLQTVQECFKKDLKIFYGFAHNDSDGPERILCEIKWIETSENFVAFKRDSY